MTKPKMQSGNAWKFSAIALALIVSSNVAFSSGWPTVDIAAITQLMQLYEQGKALVDGTQQLIQGSKDSGAAVVKAVETAYKGQVSAQSNAADAQAGHATLLAQTTQQAQTVSEYQMAPNACETAGAAEAASFARSASERTSSKTTAELQARTLGAGRTDDERVNSLKTVMASYDRTGPMPNADISPDSLLWGAGVPGRTRSYTFTPDQILAAQAFIANAIDPIPVQATLSDAQAASVDGKKYIAMRRAYSGRMALAQKPFADVLAAMTPIPGLAAKLSNAWQAMSKGIRPDAAAPNGEISSEHFMQLEIDRRYANPGWYAAVSEGSAGARQSEGLFIAALDLEMKRQELASLRKIELLLGELAARSINAEGKSDLMAQFLKVTATNR